jgi:hypothetical protein
MYCKASQVIQYVLLCTVAGTLVHSDAVDSMSVALALLLPWTPGCGISSAQQAMMAATRHSNSSLSGRLHQLKCVLARVEL